MKALFIYVFAFFASLQTLQSQSFAEILSNKTITDMYKAGLSKETVVSKIESSTCKFDVTTTGLIALKKQGLPDDIINAMLEKNSDKSIASKKTAPALTKSKSDINVELLSFIYTYYNDTIVPLEKALANTKTKTKAFGYGGTNFVLEIEGESSIVKLRPASTSAFIIKTGGEIPPDIVLYKLKITNKKRQAISAKFTLGGMKGSEGASTVNFSKLEGGVFKILVSQRLEKGEYFFLNRSMSNAGTNSEVFAFSVI